LALVLNLVLPHPAAIAPATVPVEEHPAIH